MWLNVLKNIGLFTVLIVSVVYSLPNLYKQSPAVEVISLSGDTSQINDTMREEVQKSLQDQNVTFNSIEINDTSVPSKLVITLDTYEEQIKTYQLLEHNYEDNFIISLSRQSNVPSWLDSIGGSPVNLGLDLQGGVHFLMEVDLELALRTQLESISSEIRRQLREERVRFLLVRVQSTSGIDQIEIPFRELSEAQKAQDQLNESHPQFTWSLQDQANPLLVASINPSYIEEFNNNAIEQNLVTLRNRINELGVSEPIVQQNGDRRIIVELPGVQDPAQAKKIIGSTANLEFRLEATPNSPSFETVSFPFRENNNQTAILERDIIITGDNVTNANVSYDESGSPQVNISLSGTGGRLMADYTQNAIGRRMAVLFKEVRNRTVYVTDISTSQISDLPPRTESYLTSEIISLATIQAVLGSQFRITGVGTIQEANDLALLLRAGSLSAPMHFVEERTIGPSLGARNVEQGFWSMVTGLALVLVFMIAYYKLSGIAAVTALLVNICLIISIMSFIGATLTLPGIAGIVLNLGMAVDANVLIFSRFREELKKGSSSVIKALNDGHGRAVLTIFDSNITTLIMAFILFFVGTGPVKGFAITLTIGILTSMFTSLVITKKIIESSYSEKLRKYWI